MNHANKNGDNRFNFRTVLQISNSNQSQRLIWIHKTNEVVEIITNNYAIVKFYDLNTEHARNVLQASVIFVIRRNKILVILLRIFQNWLHYHKFLTFLNVYKEMLIRANWNFYFAPRPARGICKKQNWKKKNKNLKKMCNGNVVHAKIHWAEWLIIKWY